MTKLLKMIVVNTIFAVVIWLIYRAGYVTEAWNNDIAFIVPTIIGVFVLGWLALPFKASHSDWCVETIIALGFAGTLLGIWTAFSTIDPSQVGDINSIASVIATLLHGLGAALWTTITGVFFSVWLSANIEIKEA